MVFEKNRKWDQSIYQRWDLENKNKFWDELSQLGYSNAFVNHMQYEEQTKDAAGKTKWWDLYLKNYKAPSKNPRDDNDAELERPGKRPREEAEGDATINGEGNSVDPTKFCVEIPPVEEEEEKTCQSTCEKKEKEKKEKEEKKQRDKKCKNMHKAIAAQLKEMGCPAIVKPCSRCSS